MAVIKRDYYDVLGVAPDADTETIRRAFHSLAKEWHPDIAAAPEAGARFRELAEAYSVLTNPEARQLYDRYGYRGRGNPAVEEALVGADGDPLARAENVHIGVELTSYEAERGARPVVTFRAAARCAGCMGRGSPDVPDPDCPQCQGTGRRQTLAYRDLVQIVQFTSCPACIVETCTMCQGRGTVETNRRLRLRIPAGVEDGAQLRVHGEGHEGMVGSVPGDLYALVHVLPAPRDRRMVRYLAFVLLLIAVAVLVVYVMR